MTLCGVKRLKTNSKASSCFLLFFIATHLILSRFVYCFYDFVIDLTIYGVGIVQSVKQLKSGIRQIIIGVDIGIPCLAGADHIVEIQDPFR